MIRCYYDSAGMSVKCSSGEPPAPPSVLATIVREFVRTGPSSTTRTYTLTLTPIGVRMLKGVAPKWKSEPRKNRLEAIGDARALISVLNEREN